MRSIARPPIVPVIRAYACGERVDQLTLISPFAVPAPRGDSDALAVSEARGTLAVPVTSTSAALAGRPRSPYEGPAL